MDPDFWRARWRENRIGFHEDAVHPRLLRAWPELGLASGDPVFVPMAGKSLDVGWLRAQGHPVVAVELSELAVEAFFAECGETPEIEERGPHRAYLAEGITFLAGDVFELTPADLAGVCGLYDRAALIALPPDLRARYAAHLAELLEPGVRGVVISIEYDPERMKGPPFSVPDAELRKLLEPAFEVELVEAEEGPDVVGRLAGRGLETLREAAFRVTRRSPSTTGNAGD